jgi:hypothetical protein
VAEEVDAKVEAQKRRKERPSTRNDGGEHVFGRLIWLIGCGKKKKKNLGFLEGLILSRCRISNAEDTQNTEGVRRVRRLSTETRRGGACWVNVSTEHTTGWGLLACADETQQNMVIFQHLDVCDALLQRIECVQHICKVGVFDSWQLQAL